MGQEKLAVITGGSRGIGAALVQQYAALGWQVKELSRSGEGPHHITCDFSNRSATRACVEELFSELASQSWEKIVVVNNAGMVGPVGPVNQTNSSGRYANIDVNFSAAVTLSGLFIKYFQFHPVDKYIVNISSGAAHQPRYGWSLYCAMKAALEMFSDTVALEQREEAYPVKSIIVNPGIIDTQMQKEIRDASKANFPDVQRFKAFKEDGLLASPEDVAEEIINILAAGPETGQTYSVTDKRKR